MARRCLLLWEGGGRDLHRRRGSQQGGSQAANAQDGTEIRPTRRAPAGVLGQVRGRAERAVQGDGHLDLHSRSPSAAVKAEPFAGFIVLPES
jgi:hypothetical protein